MTHWAEWVAVVLLCVSAVAASSSHAFVAVARDDTVAARANGPSSNDDRLRLPLVERRVGSAVPTLVVMLSGDGGWSTLTEKVSDELNANGYSVVGWNSLKYFWHARTPDDASADLAKIISHYVDAWHVDAVVLVGYSMGADVLPALFNRLPGAQRKRVRSIVLLAPERSTDYEFHFAGWVKRVPNDAVPIAPEMHAMRDVRVVCVYGRDEADRSLCTQLDPDDPARAIIGLPGGHHFDGDYAALARLIR